MYKINGYIPDEPDKSYLKYNRNDFDYGLVKLASDTEVDLRPYSSPRHRQFTTSTCVAQSVVKALEIKRIQKYGHDKHVDLSVLDVYYGARDLMSPKATHKDSGTYISLACNVLRRYGVCRETLFPFKEENLFIPPPILATREAYLNKIHGHFKITSAGNDRIDDIVTNLRSGNPVVFGTEIGDNWFQYARDSQPIQKTNDVKGRHAMVIVGFTKNLFIVENSWGTDWGENGFAFVAPEVFTDRATKDIWVIVEGSEAWYEKSVAKNIVSTFSSNMETK